MTISVGLGSRQQKKSLGLIRLSLVSESGDWVWRKKDCGVISLSQSMGLAKV